MTIGMPSRVRCTSNSTSSTPAPTPASNAAIVFSGARAAAPRWPTMRTELMDVVLLGDEDPRQLEALLELRRECLHAERLGRPVRAGDEIDPALTAVQLRVHRDLAGHVRVRAVLARVLDPGGHVPAAGDDRDALAGRSVLPRLDRYAEDIAHPFGELGEGAVVPPDDPGLATVIREEALLDD